MTETETSDRTCEGCGAAWPDVEYYHIPGTPYRRCTLPTFRGNPEGKCTGVHGSFYIWDRLDDLGHRVAVEMCLAEPEAGETPADQCAACGRTATWTLNLYTEEDGQNLYAPVGGCVEHDKDQVVVHLLTA